MTFPDTDQLIPAIVQDYNDGTVLMLGYMNKEAYELTQTNGRVTFFSRSKQRLWEKGETSSNFLNVKSLNWDCDKDTILILALPSGPTCHTGKISCFGDELTKDFSVFPKLEQRLQQRMLDGDNSSYTKSLLDKGIGKVAQKVGEEAVETVIAALNESRERVISESADLLYHLQVLWMATYVNQQEVMQELAQRAKPKAEV